jgi:hypothetical protein
VHQATSPLGERAGPFFLSTFAEHKIQTGGNCRPQKSNINRGLHQAVPGCFVHNELREFLRPTRWVLPFPAATLPGQVMTLTTQESLGRPRASSLATTLGQWDLTFLRSQIVICRLAIAGSLHDPLLESSRNAPPRIACFKSCQNRVLDAAGARSQILGSGEPARFSLENKIHLRDAIETPQQGAPSMDSVNCRRCRSQQAGYWNSLPDYARWIQEL